MSAASRGRPVDSDSSDAEEGGSSSSSSSSSSRGGASATLGLGDDGAYAGGSEMVDLEDPVERACRHYRRRRRRSRRHQQRRRGSRETCHRSARGRRGSGAPKRRWPAVEIQSSGGGGGGGAAAARPEMVTPLQRKALTKEGYKLIGSHSAVKLCRWTKHQLRAWRVLQA